MSWTCSRAIEQQKLMQNMPSYTQIYCPLAGGKGRNSNMKYRIARAGYNCSTVPVYTDRVCSMIKRETAEDGESSDKKAQELANTLQRVCYQSRISRTLPMNIVKIWSSYREAMSKTRQRHSASPRNRPSPIAE